MRTGAGNAVGVSEDEEGRVFFFDRAGNLYYDTGDKRLGFYIVSFYLPRSHVVLDAEAWQVFGFVQVTLPSDHPGPLRKVIWQICLAGSFLCSARQQPEPLNDVLHVGHRRLQGV